MKKLFLMSVLGLVMVSCNGQSKEETKGNQTQSEQSAAVMEDVDVKKFSDFVAEGKGLLLDVRTPDEYNAGHLEGAMHIDFYSDNFQKELSKLDQETPVYVYCRSGGRSGNAATMMYDMGFKAVYNLEGGIIAWEENGKKVVR